MRKNIDDFNSLLLNFFQLIVNGRTGLVMDHVPTVVGVGQNRDIDIKQSKKMMGELAVDQRWKS